MRIPVNFVFHVIVHINLYQRDVEAFARLLLRSIFPVFYMASASCIYSPSSKPQNLYAICEKDCIAVHHTS